MIKKVVNAKATGQSVLVELLSANDVMETSLHLGEKTKVEAPQAYIVDIGPQVDREKFGVTVGDRIVLSGGFIPLPKGDSGRQRGIIDVFSIKAVLIEGSDLIVS